MAPLLSIIFTLPPPHLQVTRYPTVNKKLVLPIQVAGLIDSDNPQMVSNISSQSQQIFIGTLQGFYNCDRLWLKNISQKFRQAM